MLVLVLATLSHVTAVLGAAKSKVPFYIAGGALVVWAFLLSMGIGRSRPDFPSDSGGERLVIGITATLVVLAAAMAVLTSGGGA
ncbi:MAG TPA: hypothetical protein VGY76_01755 [Solirubrobacteraceae bacterium]|jgi:hypothetical protein|nr:hypothetical protein [Solirubrobacteraceae bacterium]